jgi:hypothetical protein
MKPAPKDDVILYLRTMHTHDMIQQVMQIQSQNMRQLFRDQIIKDKGSVPPEFDAHFKKAMDDLIKGMPLDEITPAMITAYQQHFSKSDIEAMNTFYYSPVGPKVLKQLPVMQRIEAAMPIVSKYREWKIVEQEMKEMDKSSPKPEAQLQPN